ncbi:MAG: RICIN domain-containing protein [Pseudoflavonifractor sp.]|nr:RICIN domain-containing protein [Alloprevotella sp.]MCM1117555.1 RICIN domain-containing protein [Pseudoflavonifractor sp.]
MATNPTGSIVTLSYQSEASNRISTIDLIPTGMSEQGINLWSGGNNGLGGYTLGDLGNSWRFTRADIPTTSTDEEEHWYAIRCFGHNKYVSSTGTEGVKMKPLDIDDATHPIQLWKLQTGEDGKYIITGKKKENSGDLIYCKMDGGVHPSSEPQEWFILPTGINDFGYAISTSNPMEQTSCFATNNAGTEINAWKPSSNETEWKNSTWVFEEVDQDFIDYYNAYKVTYVDKASNGFIINSYTGALASDGQLDEPVEIAGLGEATTVVTDADGNEITVSGNTISATSSVTVTRTYAEDAHLAIKARKIGDIKEGEYLMMYDASNRHAFRYTSDAKTVVGNTSATTPEAMITVGVTASHFWTVTHENGQYMMKNVATDLYVNQPGEGQFSANADTKDAALLTITDIARNGIENPLAIHYGSDNVYFDGYPNGDMVGWAHSTTDETCRAYQLFGLDMYYEVTEKWLTADGEAIETLPEKVTRVAVGESYTLIEKEMPIGHTVTSTEYGDGGSEASLTEVSSDLSIIHRVSVSNVVTYINRTTEGYLISKSQEVAEGADYTIAIPKQEGYSLNSVFSYTSTGIKNETSDGNSITLDGDITIVSEFTTTAHIEADFDNLTAAQPIPYVNSLIYDTFNNVQDRRAYRTAINEDTKIGGIREINKNDADQLRSIQFMLESYDASGQYLIKSINTDKYIKFNDVKANAEKGEASPFKITLIDDGSNYTIYSTSTSNYWNGDGDQGNYGLATWSTAHPYQFIPLKAKPYYEVTERWLTTDGAELETLPAKINHITPGESFTSSVSLPDGYGITRTNYSEGSDASCLNAVNKDFTITYTVSINYHVTYIDKVPNGFIISSQTILLDNPTHILQQASEIPGLTYESSSVTNADGETVTPDSNGVINVTSDVTVTRTYAATAHMATTAKALADIRPAEYLLMFDGKEGTNQGQIFRWISDDEQVIGDQKTLNDIASFSTGHYWTLSQSGDGYKIQNVKNGKYIKDDGWNVYANASLEDAYAYTIVPHTGDTGLDNAVAIKRGSKYFDGNPNPWPVVMWSSTDDGCHPYQFIGLDLYYEVTEKWLTADGNELEILPSKVTHVTPGEAFNSSVSLPHGYEIIETEGPTENELLSVNQDYAITYKIAYNDAAIYRDAVLEKIERLKREPALFPVDEMDTYIAELEALSTADADLQAKVDAIYNEAYRSAEGKKFKMWVMYQAVTPNAPYYMTDSEGMVKGIATADANSYWTLEWAGEAFRIKNNNGKYIGDTPTFSTVEQAHSAGLFHPEIDGEGIVVFKMHDKTGENCLDINHSAAITLYYASDPHAKWHIVGLEDDLAALQQEIADANAYLEGLPNTALLAGSGDARAKAKDTLGTVDFDLIAASDDIAEAIAEARAKISESTATIVEDILTENADENRGLPFLIYRTKRDGSTRGYMAVQNSKVTVVTDKTNPSALWIANFTEKQTGSRAMEANEPSRFTLFNPASGLYIKSISASASLGLTQSNGEAVSFTLYPGSGGVAFDSGDDPTARKSIHLDGSNNVVGWDATNDYSKWMMEDVTVDEVNAMGEAVYPADGAGSSADVAEIIGSLKATSMWTDETIEALGNMSAAGYKPQTDKKAAAAAFGQSASAAQAYIVPITSKLFSLSSDKLAAEGAAESYTPDAATQHRYASIMGVNGNAIKAYGAPVDKAQWSFNIANNQLYMQVNGSYIKGGNDGSISLVSTVGEATPVTITKSGDKSLSVAIGGKKLTVSQEEMALKADTEGTPFTMTGLMDVVSEADGETYFTIMSYDRGKFLTANSPVSGEGARHIDFNDQALWRLERANTNGGYYIANFIEGLYLNISGGSPMLSTDKAIWYLTANGADNGRGYAIRATVTGSGLDASNANDGISTWTPTTSDWRGTTWAIAPASEALVASKEGVKEALYQTTVDNIPGRLEQLTAIPELFDPSYLSQVRAQVEAIATDETLGAKEKAARMEERVTTLFGYAQEVPFLLINRRRLENTLDPETTNADNGYCLAYNLTYDGNGNVDKKDFRTQIKTNYRSLWRLEYAGQGTFYLKAGNEAWMGTIPSANETNVQAVTDFSASNVGRFVFINNTAEGGEPTFGIATFNQEPKPAARGLNIRKAGDTGAVGYGCSDDGSRWSLQLPPAQPMDDPQIDGVYVISSYKRANKLLGVNPAVMSDPAETKVSSIDANAGAFWQITSTPAGAYTLLNLLSGRYLAHNLGWSDEPVEWHITPNAAPEDEWDMSNLGVSISTDAKRSSCIDQGGNGNLSMWKPSATDFEGTTWIITRSDLTVASKLARNSYNSDKANYEAKWIRELLPDAAAMVPGWARIPFDEAYSQYLGIKQEMDKNQPAEINYVDLLRERNALWQQTQKAITQHFIDNAAGHSVQISNKRRADRFGEFNTEYLLAQADDGSRMVSYDNNRQELSTVWHFEPNDEGTALLIINEQGKYIGKSDSPSSLTDDRSQAGQFNIRYVIYSAYEEGDYRARYGIGLAYAGTDKGLHGALTSNAPMSYGLHDDGSLWLLSDADYLGIGNVTVGDDDVIDFDECELYTLDGRRVSLGTAAPGIYIARRADGRAVKVAIK